MNKASFNKHCRDSGAEPPREILISFSHGSSIITCGTGGKDYVEMTCFSTNIVIIEKNILQSKY